VELAELAAEAGAGDEAAPGLADERRAGEARRLVRREAEEDLLDELLHQRRRRRRRAGWLRREGLVGVGADLTNHACVLLVADWPHPGASRAPLGSDGLPG
jgi:hypothetical protein